MKKNKMRRAHGKLQEFIDIINAFLIREFNDYGQKWDTGIQLFWTDIKFRDKKVEVEIGFHGIRMCGFVGTKFTEKDAVRFSGDLLRSLTAENSGPCDIPKSMRYNKVNIGVNCRLTEMANLHECSR